MAYYYDSVTTTDKTIDDDVNEVKTVCFSPLCIYIYIYVLSQLFNCYGCSGYPQRT